MKTTKRLISLMNIVILFAAAAFVVNEESRDIGKVSTEKLIISLNHKRIQNKYYDYEALPQYVKELIVRPDIVTDLAVAYDKGGSDLYRFNLIVILNHKVVTTDDKREEIIDTLEIALNDPSPQVRMEAVWGLGIHKSTRSLFKVASMLDDESPIVVNEVVLTLGKLRNVPNLPVSNSEMSPDDRRKLVEFWKGWLDRIEETRSAI